LWRARSPGKWRTHYIAHLHVSESATRFAPPTEPVMHVQVAARQYFRVSLAHTFGAARNRSGMVALQVLDNADILERVSFCSEHAESTPDGAEHAHIIIYPITRTR